jgi:membrane protein DedA with SNARE-associated domain
MLINVDDPIRNLILNGCFYVILAATLIALVPWKFLGAERVSRMLRWLVLPVVGLAVGYEAAMPSRFDIRIDLLLLLPLYFVVLATSVFRWIGWRRADKR